MKNVSIARPLGVSVVAALMATALPFAPASAAPGTVSLEATSKDGLAFQPADYASGDVTVQVTDSVAGPVDAPDTQDLAFSWTVTPYGPGAAPVQVPATGTDVQATDVKGAFVVALPIGQGPGTYELDAALVDGTGTEVVPSTSLLALTVGNAAPAGSTAVISGLGDGTPGEALDATLTVAAPDSSPIAGQAFSLTIDRGFFTTGDGAVPPVVGQRAGDLESLGKTYTGVTDADGTIDFEVGIARDAGFDDDGRVTAAVSVAAGPSATASAQWDTLDTLNGQVALKLSPAAEQDGPVNPTLAGNRTFYDVFALDQFGNRVGDVPIDLSYSGNLDDYDYSDDDTLSDFDTFGDIWITSYEAGRIGITGTWEDAPTYRYVDRAGTADSGVEDASGSITSTTYEISFGASRYSITSSAKDTVRVGTAVSQTVRVVDQQGNPVSGYQVRFLRFGPDDVRGDVVATRTTSSLGQATYTFVGTKRGRAKITAEITDGIKRRQLTGTAVFGAAVKARLVKGKGGPGADRLSVRTRKLAVGARVQIYRVDQGVWRLAATKRLSRAGAAEFSVRDRNRTKKTTYVAMVRSTSTSVADQSNAVKIR